MSRKKRDFKRVVLPDPRYGDVVVGKAINVIMDSGKKGVAERALYGALDTISKKTGADAVETFHKALSNIKPVVEVRSRRVGGANYQVPREVRPERRLSLSMKWIIGAARLKKGQPIHVKLADELIAASKSEGEAFKKRENVHKMAEANKAFAHFAW